VALRMRSECVLKKRDRLAALTHRQPGNAARLIT
jgi:hypothetical protein